MGRLGALEAGGTKMVLSVGDESGSVFERMMIPTGTPGETMPAMIEFFRRANVGALGIGCFGPLDLNPDSKTFGSITTTPKIAWRDFPITAAFREALRIPVAIDTDVNAAALAEHRLGAGKGKNSCLYVTVGTGIGGGVIAEGRLLHGLLHPEWGHIRVLPHPDDPMPGGVCPSHGGCLEGLASGYSMEKRWGMPGRALDEEHIGWRIEAYYLAQLCATAVLTLSPEVIVLGGGVMSRAALFPLIREEVRALLGGYIAHPGVLDGIGGYIVPPGLGGGSGVTGALLLAADALKEAAAY